ncbi:hypothetical protein [Streptomyces sp. NPDC013457]
MLLSGQRRWVQLLSTGPYPDVLNHLFLRQPDARTVLALLRAA